MNASYRLACVSQLVFTLSAVVTLLLSPLWITCCHGQAIENLDASNLTVSKFYTFTKTESHILLSANGNIADRVISSKKDIIFYFRTRYANGVLLQESFYLSNSNKSVFTLLLALRRGRFTVLLEYEGQQEETLIGYGFHKDYLHRVHLYTNPELGFLNIQIANAQFNQSEGKYYKSMYFNSTFVQSNQTLQALHRYRLTLGGFSDRRLAANYELNGYRNFVGCIGNLQIVSRSSRSNNFGTLSLSQLTMNALKEGCIDQCNELNLCSSKARCVNYYDLYQCDCFGTTREDWHCRNHNYTVVTLRGYSSISYRIYPHLYKSYTDEQRISMHLKTKFDAFLFAVLSETHQNYLILNIKNGFLHLLFSLGQSPKNYIFNDFKLTDNRWHNLTIVQRHTKMFVHLDTWETHHEVELDTDEPYFYFDPEIYIGGLPSNVNISSWNLPIYLPNKKFVGCLKHVYYNSINVLYNLYNNYTEAKYHSLFPLTLGCQQVNSVPITIQPQSNFKLSYNKTSVFTLEFEVRTAKFNSKIVNGTFLTRNNIRHKWVLLMRNLDVKLSIEPDTGGFDYSKSITWTLSNDNSLNVTEWNHVMIAADHNGFISMNINELNVQGRYDLPVEYFFGDIYLGSIEANLPFVGCMQNVLLNGRKVDPHTLASRGAIVGSVTLDDCILVDPCQRPNACEHGGVCIPVAENGTYYCDCSNTGYIGESCHFSFYRKSCQEIYLMDKRHSGIYMIDIDRNGPLPPAHVICELIKHDDGSYSTRTVIEHNIQHQVIVREKGKSGNFVMDVVYRDFSQQMLRQLVQRSPQCRQYVKYECNDAPLGLSTYTLLYSTVPDYKLARIDSSNPRGCRCAGPPNKCLDSSKDCNCDTTSNGWKHDEGYLTSSKDVGITKMFFRQYPNYTRDSEAHLFLGNLSCIDLDTQKYEITFKTKESYLQVPGWSGHEMGISFRTTASKAVIFYQAHLDSVNTYFKAVIVGENEVNFEYSVHGRKKVITINSGQCLNCGQWQHIWIERNHNQMRVSINQNSRIMRLGKNERFIDFDGKLFVGGAPLEYFQGQQINYGFIGCLRGLVLDSLVVDLHKYLDYNRKPNIESGCRPYCRPNLCQNQGQCVELWGSYECKCSNPIAHSGTNCQFNINENSITLKKATSIRLVYTSAEIGSILHGDIVLSFRTHSKFALLLFAHDTKDNFIQVHIENGAQVVFTFNWRRRIVRRDIVVGSALVSGQTIQLKIDRTYKNSSLFTVNQKSIFIPYPVELLREGSSLDKRWTVGQEYELVKFNRSIEAHSWQMNELFIGGIFNSEEAFSLVPNFVGCIQGLRLGTKLVDLQAIADSMEIADSVKSGCMMLCDQMPCKNGGICTEDWENESTKCDCDSTSYRGELCDVDIGAFFQKNSSVLYYLEKDTILDFTNVEISFAFSSFTQENATLFLLRYANSSRYLHLALLADGRLMVEEDNGHDIYLSVIESEEDTFLDSHRHWIRYIRKERFAQIIVDSLIYMVSESNYVDTVKHLAPSNVNMIQVGSSRVSTQKQSHFSNFKGCISNINILLDDFRIDPFESAFGIRSGLNKVKVSGDIKQGICAAFRTHRTSIAMQLDHKITWTNREEIWLNRPKPKLVRYNRTDISRQSKSYIRTDILMGLCAGYLLAVLLFCLIYLWRIDRRYRLLKFQGETPFFHKKTDLLKNKYRI